MARQIQGAQRDFSFGQVDVELKRADDHPARKSGLRQMANARILNSGAVQNRSGRRALFPVGSGSTRIEEFTIAAGKIFKMAFGPHILVFYDSNNAIVSTLGTQGNGAALPWVAADVDQIVYAILGSQIFITFPGMIPQICTWNGIVTFTLADYSEVLIGGRKRTLFYRISKAGTALLPNAQTGVGITITASEAVFTAAHVGTRIRYIGRQILVTAFIDPATILGTPQEPLPGSQNMTFAVDPSATYSIGDEVIGSVTGSKGIVTVINAGLKTISVQLITTNVTSVTTGSPYNKFGDTETTTIAFTTADTIAGPGGSLVPTGIAALGPPQAVTLWDDEVMNALRGYPASCFVDQFRVGFCDFPALPGAIAWSAINAPTDLYVDGNSSNAIFELAPSKTRVLYVVPGPESSEFVFCDRGIYYIPISTTNPLKPGSVAFQLLSGDGAAQVQPRVSQEAIVFVNAGGSNVMAVIATGAYLRPFNIKNLSDFHGRLFNNIAAIAVPSADGTFAERYAYVLNGDGSIVVGKYDPQTLPGNQPVIGWGAWSGVGNVTWIAAWAADVLFTASYLGAPVCEILDDAQYLDCALAVNALPAAFVPPAGKGPLWFIATQSAVLIDQVTRVMGTYQIDANGFIVPKFTGGEDLTVASLIAGQPWTMTVEPFCPDASPGADVGQRMDLRYIARFAAYVLNSTGFMLAKLFSAKETATSPALGTVMNTRRVPAYNLGDDATKPPKLRETAESWRPSGGSYDPRVAIIKDVPGPLLIAEIGIEISI